MKKCIWFLLIFLAIASNASAQVQPTDTDGDGYINISTLDHLRWVSENKSSWASKFELDNTINAAPTASWNAKAGFSPIGDSLTSFIGKFEGNGFDIDGLFINRPETNDIGFFGTTNGAQISNIGITNCHINGRDNVGGLIGKSTNSSKVINSYSTGVVEGVIDIGGLIGNNGNSMVVNATSLSNVSGNNHIGGLVGINNNSTLNNCYCKGYVDAFENGGGLVGLNSSSSTISNCYSTSDVKGTWYSIGGLVGENSHSIIRNCYSTGNVNGSYCTGGLVGLNDSSKVTNSYSTSKISGDVSVGGLVGSNHYSTVSNCYSTGYVDGSNTYIGGLLGTHVHSVVINSYSIGKVVGRDHVGGLVGCTNEAVIINCFWDTQTSTYTFQGNGTGKTTTEMQTKSTFTNVSWNFKSIWDIHPYVNNGYPYIKIRELTLPGIEPPDTDGDGYRNISCYSHLHWISNNSSSWAWNYELDNNINADTTYFLLDDLGFAPIGNDTTNFSGKFEGHGFAIDSLYIHRLSNYIGLFGITSGTEISNVGFTNCEIISNNFVGGLVGKNMNNSTLNNCYSNGYISSRDTVGGLVGENNNSTLNNCYNNGIVSGEYTVGGLVGSNINNSTLNNCYSNGNISGEYTVGGLIGQNNSSTVNYCYNNGTTLGNYLTGGLVGQNNDNAIVQTSFCIGKVSGDSYIGGLVGENNSSTVNNCYNNGVVSGRQHIGGLIGRQIKTSILSNSYSSGKVPGNLYIGGLVEVGSASTVSNCFWNKETGGCIWSAGGNSKTTTEMKTKSTFTSAGWDFEKIWAIDPNYNDGYPNLEGKNGHSGIIAQSSESFIYPQPASDELFVKLSETTDATAFIRIYDQTGQLALTSGTSASDGLIRLNTSALSSGVYQMIITIAGKNYTDKVVVVK